MRVRKLALRDIRTGVSSKAGFEQKLLIHRTGMDDLEAEKVHLFGRTDGGFVTR